MRLYEEVSGSGPDLVLLHGWGADGGIWSDVVANLRSRFTLHALDLPGYGASQQCDPYTLERIAANLAAEMPARCLVCGWSLGGQLALAWAAAAPRQVAKLVLIATTPCFVRREDWPHAVPYAALRAFSSELAADRAGTIRRFLSLQAMGSASAKRVARRMAQKLFARGVPEIAVLEKGLKLLLESDLRDRLRAIEQPTLVLQGEHDALVPLAAGAFLSNAIRKSCMVRVPGAGHAPFLTNPGAVRDAVCDFLNGR